MALKVQGMQSIIDQLDKMEKVGDKHCKKALEEAGNYVKDIEVEVAKRVHGLENGKRYSQDVGWKELKRYPVKLGRQGGRFVNIGIRATLTSAQKKKEDAAAKAGVKRATHWDKIKGLIYSSFMQ